MKLLVAPPRLRGTLVREAIEARLGEGRKVLLLMFEPSTLSTLGSLAGVRSGEEADLMIMNSILADGSKSLLMFASLLGRYNFGVIDELYGAYLTSLSSATRDRPYNVRRKFVMLLSLIKHLEKNASLTVEAYTSIREVGVWILDLFDEVVRLEGSSDGRSHEHRR